MDKRKSYYIILDTETTPLDVNDPFNNMLVYDLGFAVVDKKGNIYKTYSYVIKEIFFNNNLMRSAYYYEKVPKYLEDIITGERQLINFIDASTILFQIFYKWNCKAIIAHNAYFDYNALNTTLNYLSPTTKRLYFFPYNFPIWDSLKMSRDVLKTRKTYSNFCLKHGYMTKHKKPRPQLKAEVIYKWLTDNIDFTESHTGLEDVLIETEIFSFCMNAHCKMKKDLFTKK